MSSDDVEDISAAQNPGVGTSAQSIKTFSLAFKFSSPSP